MIRQFITSFFTLCILGNLICTGVSASSQLIYNGVTSNDVDSATSSHVAINNDNTVIASSYSKDLMLHDASNFLEIDKIEFQRNIHDLMFSPDGKTLAITIVGTSELVDSVHIYDMENMVMKAEKGKSNSQRSNIEWSPDSEFLAVANFDNGINLIDVNTMNIVREYSNQHQTDVTCIGFTNDGDELITGDLDGNLKLWNFDGTFTGTSFQLDSEIVGCGFNYLDQRISAVSLDGEISTWLKSGSLLHEKNITKASGMLWSKSLDKLYVLESGSSPRMLELDGSTFNEVSSTYFMHKAEDFDIYFLANGVIEDLYMATDTSHISNYAQPELRFGYGQLGSDYDGDGIPDSIDNDDDGDSYLDDWDFNCPADVLECHRSPDMDTIRNVKVKISGTSLTIEDTFTFGLYESAEIRNLTRRASISDRQISYEEANLFENAICQNLDISSMINSWKNSLEFSVGQVENGTLNCIVIDGLVLKSTFDPNGIKLMFRISFDIIPSAVLPLDLTIIEQVSHSDSSITHLVENHPIYVSHQIQNELYDGKIWWKSEGAITVAFEEIEVEEDPIESFLEMVFSNWILLSLGILVLIGALFIVIRKRNAISIEMEEIGNEQEFSDHDNTIEVSKPEPITYSEKLLQEEEEVIQGDMKQNDDISPANRKSFIIDDLGQESIQPKRRKVNSTNRNKQGPIMATKRKVLGGNNQTQSPKKVNIKTVKKNIKTRKVRVTKKDFED